MDLRFFCVRAESHPGAALIVAQSPDLAPTLLKYFTLPPIAVVEQIGN